MTNPFRHRRAQYYEGEPAPARALVRYHLSERESAGLIATETSHPPRFAIPSHAHDLPSFYLVLRGSLTESSDAPQQELDACSVVFTPAGHIHRNAIHEAGARCFLIELTSAWAQHLAAAGVATADPIVSKDGAVFRTALGLYREFRAPHHVSALAVESLTLELLVALARRYDVAEHDTPAWVRRARHLLHDRFAEPLSLADLARELGVHPIRLVRTFRKRCGCSPAEYQRRLRVDYASRQLAITRRPLSEIALSAGFADQPHFSRVFKTHTGFTPRRFRETLAVH